MTRPTEFLHANDDDNVVDLLIAAHAVCGDNITKRFIELALLHEGRKISATLPKDQQTG